ncbi:ammonium transporter [Fontivita pretiosa]|uniref:ammonium transporter n=1 Tax=Fontivita pretiosa TaxID=2989684 RepID=UPI003D17B409
MNMDTGGWMVLILAGATTLVRAGQLLGAMGLVRAKNVASTGFRILMDLCISALCFWAVGAAILFQVRNPVLGVRLEYLLGMGELPADWLRMLAAVLIATGIVSPAVAERSKLVVPLAAAALLATLLVPLLLHWTTRGWLSQLGLIDTAGAAAVQLAGGACAATAAFFVGPRQNKYNRDGSSNMIPGHNIPLMLLGTMLILIGWIAYVAMMAFPAAGPVAGAARGAHIPANVLVAAAAAGLLSLVVARIRYGKADVLLSCAGILGGLVSITAAAGTVRSPAAFVIGAVAGILVPWMLVSLDLRVKLDDPGGVVAIHGVGAIWALLAAGIFRYASLEQWLWGLAIQALAIGAVLSLVVACTAGLMLALHATTGLRAADAEEYDGLDLAEHDINAHPDFQQTMIKSYHLREA